MKEELNKEIVEVIRSHYGCQGKYPCSEFAHCQFGNGYNSAYYCNECGADEFYEGYLRALKDRGEKEVVIEK